MSGFGNAPEKLAEEIYARFSHKGPYYDACADKTAADAYWAGVNWDASSADLFPQLRARLSTTHDPELSYRSARHEFLYPAIDLHPDGQLHNIYSGAKLDPREAMSREFASVIAEADTMGFAAAFMEPATLVAQEGIWDAVEEAAANLPFNCEHVVPQSWFQKQQPMRGDLHHLFACEPGCNSFRSNIPYWQFPPRTRAVRDFCGRREGNKFEPEHSKGVVARATFYFLMRYPGEIGDRRSELTKNRIKLLLDWHETFEISEYERHRNWLIEKAQGNRNPFIDRPDAASAALLRRGFGVW